MRGGQGGGGWRTGLPASVLGYEGRRPSGDFNAGTAAVAAAAALAAAAEEGGGRGRGAGSRVGGGVGFSLPELELMLFS